MNEFEITHNAIRKRVYWKDNLPAMLMAEMDVEPPVPFILDGQDDKSVLVTGLIVYRYYNGEITSRAILLDGERMFDISIHSDCQQDLFKHLRDYVDATWKSLESKDSG